MISSYKVLHKIDEQIKISNDAICRHIGNLEVLGRGAASQDILKNLRDFLEHIMFKIYAGSHNVTYDYQNIKDAVNFVKARGQLRFLWGFHKNLQSTTSHYLLEPEGSERLMLKYYEYLLKVKYFLKVEYSFDVLANIDQFPLNTDKNLQEYYEKIASKLSARNSVRDLDCSVNERCYVHKIKPFFVKGNVYYEVTLIPASGRASKFDRIVAFTVLDISKYYAVKLWTVKDTIQILGKTMPIFAIVQWEVSIRPCEIERFLKIFGEKLRGQGNSSEYRGLMHFLTQTGFNLVELLCFEDAYYQESRVQILARYSARTSHLFDLFDRSREIIRNNKPGCNVLRYILYHMNNRIIHNQLGENNHRLSGLCLSNGCIPFDKMPFCTSLLNHNPKFSEVLDCVDSTDRMHEFLARYIRNNAEKDGQLYTSVEELAGFEDIDELIQVFNSNLYDNPRQQARRIEKRNGHLYIRGYEDNTIKIINKLTALSEAGVQNYSNYVDDWLANNTHSCDCDEKKEALRQMFSDSHVALIYGSAGTGKSTLVNHISHLFPKQDKLYLANTNPAVDNLKRRVDASNCKFMTIYGFLKKQDIKTNYDLLIIDECSTVSNQDMVGVMSKATFELLVLVGDIYQIEAIRFGNWFSASQSFLPDTSVYELVTPHRSRNNKELQTLWDKVRKMDDAIVEFMASQGYSASLDASIFNPAESDEIILCLNYDGLYGINNINRFLQEANSNPAISWGLQSYKVGDPILFNESERFAPLIYNNMKGRIVGISELKNQIRFDIELDMVINGLEARGYDFELLKDSAEGCSTIRFAVEQYKSTDEDNDASSLAIVPFQVAYAVSIHKAQGLEYNSVKIVITDEVEELITHSIFYTAITRTREKLKVYWTPEVEKKVLSSIKPRSNAKDVALLKSSVS
jgi:energy-coupling factor transporter ATP-binding protein EcfA2